MIASDALDTIEACLKAHPAGTLEIERSYIRIRLREINGLVAAQEAAYRRANGQDERGRWRR